MRMARPGGRSCAADEDHLFLHFKLSGCVTACHSDCLASSATLTVLAWPGRDSGAATAAARGIRVCPGMNMFYTGMIERERERELERARES